MLSRTTLIWSCVVSLVTACRSQSSLQKEETGSASPLASIDAAQHDAFDADGLVKQMEQYENDGMALTSLRECPDAETVFSGSIEVASDDYANDVLVGEEIETQPLTKQMKERKLTAWPSVTVTLQYPFSKSHVVTITGNITLQRAIDAIRSGFREMYKGTTVRDIPGMYNKDVTGPFGRSFHAIDDLVIEQIDVCADHSLRVTIGS